MTYNVFSGTLNPTQSIKGLSKDARCTEVVVQCAELCVVDVWQARQVLSRLAAVVGCVDGAELFDRHTVDVLMSMDNTYQTWTQHSAERLIFDALLLEAGQTFSCFLPFDAVLCARRLCTVIRTLI